MMAAVADDFDFIRRRVRAIAPRVYARTIAFPNQSFRPRNKESRMLDYDDQEYDLPRAILSGLVDFVVLALGIVGLVAIMLLGAALVGTL